tara:strand:- start:272 stop:448 length:177 start_codon:yes stop_codon:yes gene_type:complete
MNRKNMKRSGSKSDLNGHDIKLAAQCCLAQVRADEDTVTLIPRGTAMNTSCAPLNNEA